MAPHKRILNNIFTGVLAGLIILVMIFFSRVETAGFNKSLYILQNSKTTGLYFYDIIGRIAASAILAVLGVMCMFLSVLAHDNGGFLQCARMFFFAAGFTATLWDYKIAFYLNSVSWRVNLFYIGDVCLAWYAASVIRLLFGMAETKHYRRVTAVTVGGAAALTVVLHFSGTTDYVRYELGYLVFCGSALLVFSGLLLHQDVRSSRVKRSRLGADIVCILECASAVAFMGFIYFNKIRTGSAFYKMYLSYSSICIILFSLLLFYQFFQFERAGILFGGQENRKLQEIKKQKLEIGRIVANNCIGPLNLIHAQVGQLLENADEVGGKRILRQVIEELDRLQDYFHNLNAQGSSDEAHHAREHIAFQLSAHLKYAVDLYEKSTNEERPYIFWECADAANSVVNGDPYELLQANLNLIKLLLRASAENQLCLKESREGGKICVCMETVYAREKSTLPKQFKRILRSRKASPRLSNLDDVAIFNIRQILNNHDAEISVRTAAENGLPTISVKYALCCHSAVSVAKDGLLPEKENLDLLLLLSSSKEQENTIRTYLTGENYKLVVFRQGDDVLEFLENQHNVRTIIMDSADYAIGMGDIAERIRERYPIETLPILLICPAGFQKLLQKESFRYINDVLMEPFDKTALTWKLYAMVLLQDSARKSLSTRLDFLQSQMDPHFIFNTLSSIMPLCISNPHEAYEMLTDFSDYLRGRLYPQELQHPVYIEREIDLVTAFLAIEQKRFPNRIEYHMDLDYSEDSTIIPLLIEPIVENCVVHGMKETGVLHIDISVLQDGEFIYCCVKDDGKGFDSKNFLQNVEKSASRSIGIKNVRDRLKIYYHEDMYINGVPGEGTEVSFKFRCM